MIERGTAFYVRYGYNETSGFIALVYEPLYIFESIYIYTYICTFIYLYVKKKLNSETAQSHGNGRPNFLHVF